MYCVGGIPSFVIICWNHYQLKKNGPWKHKIWCWKVLEKSLIFMSSFLYEPCNRADSVLDSHVTGPGFKTRWVRYTFYWASNLLPLQKHHRVECSLCVWKVENDFPTGCDQRHYYLCIPVWCSTSMDSTMTSLPRVCILWRGWASWN